MMGWRLQQNHRLWPCMRFTLACCLALVAATTASHELNENRASLVLRQERLVSVTFYLNIGVVLLKTLNPEQNLFEHTARLSTMGENEFAKQYARAKNLLETSVRFKTDGDQTIRATHWQWPDAHKVQQHLRQWTMQATVATDQHTHENPLEVSLQLQSEQEIRALVLELPAALRPMTVVSSRPKQSRIDPATLRARITF